MVIEPGPMQDVASALNAWVKAHPAPTQPTLMYLGQSYSPLEIYEAVVDGSDLGQEFSSFLFAAAQRFDTTVQKLVWEMIDTNYRVAGPR